MDFPQRPLHSLGNCYFGVSPRFGVGAILSLRKHKEVRGRFYGIFRCTGTSGDVFRVKGKHEDVAMKDTGQIILCFFILAMAITVIPIAFVYGDVFYGSEIGAQLFLASFGFVILILQICVFVYMAQDTTTDA